MLLGSDETITLAILSVRVRNANPFASRHYVYNTSGNTGVGHDAERTASKFNRGSAFWMILLTVCMCNCISALELNCVSTALPTIAFELQGSGFVWVASAYALASTASISLGGDMAEAFGRSPVMLMALAIFALGSALSGSARSMDWLIAARTVQGIGAGGLISVPPLVLADIVPLKERGLYQGFVSLVYAIFSAVGPFLGGAIAQNGKWRWLFYMALPVCGICLFLVATSVKLQIPQGTVLQKLKRMDWMGCFLIMGGSTACCIALTWAGVDFPWESPQVLVPLILGLCSLVSTIVFGHLFSKRPIIPLSLLNNRTSFSGYIQNFIAPFILYTVVYYIPLYWQACKDASPMRSGVDTLGLSVSVGPISIIAGFSVAYFNKYRIQCYIGWAMYLIGCGLMSMVGADTPIGPTIIYSIIVTGGGGALYAITNFPVLAPLPVTDNGRALTFYMFLRTFSTAWGISVGGSVVQNQLQKRLPGDLGNSAASFAYNIIPQIKDMPEPLKSELRVAFADSISVLWQTMIGIAGIGFMACFLMREVPMKADLDANWGAVDVPSSEIL